LFNFVILDLLLFTLLLFLRNIFLLSISSYLVEDLINFCESIVFCILIVLLGDKILSKLLFIMILLLVSIFDLFIIESISPSICEAFE
jgi:hypothetical protein